MLKSFQPCWLLLIFILVSCGESEPTLIPDGCISSIYEGDVILATQSDINAFGETCYTSVDGILQIGQPGIPSNINDLSPLAEVRSASELIVVSNPELRALDDLQLKQIHDRILISDNLLLEDISRLAEVRNDHIAVTISRNPSLSSLVGLNQIQRFSNLDIVDNKSLRDLLALSTAERMNCLYIEKNDLLTSLDGLENLNNLNCVYIRGNRSLIDYCALTKFFSREPRQLEFECIQNGFDISLQDLINGKCSID